MVQPLWRTVWRFLKKLKLKLLYDSVVPPMGIYLKKTLVQKDTRTTMFTAMLFTTAKTQKLSKCPLTDEWTKKMRYMHTVEHDSIRKKSEIMPFGAT